MTRSHAKNTHTQSTLSYHERSQIRRATDSKRLGAESFKSFDACHLCLSTLVSPVSCSKGHMYCRECALANLVSQKAGIEAQKREMARWEANEEVEKEQAKARARERAMADFEKGMGLAVAQQGPGQNKQGGVSASASAPIPTDTRIGAIGSRIGIKMDDSALETAAKAAESKALAKIEQEQAESRRTKLAAFWLPSLAPEARVGPVKDIKLQTLCHYGGLPHPFSLKTLIPVKLHYPPSSKTPHCPSCARELSNSMSSFLLSSREPANAEADPEGEDIDRPAKKAKKDKKDKKDKPAPFCCGHVVCKQCVDTIVRPAGRCSVCEAKVGEEGMIPVGKDGTGFAAAGGAEVKDSNAILFRM